MTFFAIKCALFGKPFCILTLTACKSTQTTSILFNQKVRIFLTKVYYLSVDFSCLDTFEFVCQLTGKTMVFTANIIFLIAALAMTSSANPQQLIAESRMSFDLATPADIKALQAQFDGKYLISPDQY